MSGIYMHGGGAAPRDTTLRDLLAVVFKYKWLILSTTALATILVAYRTLTTPVTYTADATIMLNRQSARSSVMDRAARQLPWVEAVESEVQVLQSGPVLQGAIALLDQRLAGEAKNHGLNVTRLGKAIKAGIVGESNVIFVSGTARTPELASAIANAVADSYCDYHNRMFAMPDPSGFLQARVDSLYEEMQNLQNLRGEVYADVGLTNIVEQEQTLIRERSSLRTDLARTQSRSAKLEVEVAAARTYLEDGSLSLAFLENAGNYQVGQMGAVSNDYERALGELGELRQRFTEQHPDVIEAQRKVDSLRERLHGWVKENLRVRETALTASRGEEASLQRAIQAIDVKLAVLPRQVAELQMVDAKLSSVSKQYEDFHKEAVTMSLSAASYRPEDVVVLSEAHSPRRNKKGDPIRLALGPILALFAGIGLAFYLENLDHSLRTREDVEQHLEIPVLASFPEVEVDQVAAPAAPSRIPFRRREKA